MNAVTKGVKTIYTIWLREAKTFAREKGRVIAMIGQPLLYLAILGKGISSGMRLTNAGNIEYIKFMYPGVIGMSILFTSIFSAISIIWDREFGFLKEVLVAPVPRWGVALGKTLGGATVAMVQAVIMVGMAPLVGISLSIVLVAKLIALAFLMSIAVTSLGIVIASRMASMQSFQMVMNFMVMPLYFLSGAMFPMANVPGWMKTLMMADPLTYGVDAIRNVVFSATTIQVGQTTRSLLDVAGQAGLIRWGLGFDVVLMTLAAAALAGAGAWSFSKSQAA
jgi:ABC-2 type transport system permease protein